MTYSSVCASVSPFSRALPSEGPSRFRGGPSFCLGTKLICAVAQSLSSKVQYDKEHRGCRAVLVAPL